MNSKVSSQKALIFATVFLYLVGFGVIIPILPLLGRELGGTAAEVGWLMAIFSLMQFIFAPFWGQLSDRYGRRNILVGCLLAEAFTYIWFALARDYWSLFFARALAGFFGASISTASAYISDITSTQERSKGMALIGVAFGLGFVIGPAIGGGLVYLSKQFSSDPLMGSTTAAFFVGFLCFCTFVFAYFKLPESLPPEKRSPAFKKSTNRFLRIINKFKLAKLRSLLGLFFLAGLSMSAIESTLVFYVGEIYGWGPDKMSYGFVYIGIIIILTQGYLVRKLIPKIGERRLLVVGLSLFSFGSLGIAVSKSLVFLTIAITFFSVGNGLTNPSILGSISIVSSENEQGENLGVAQSLASLGRILGPLLGGTLYDKISVTSPFVAAWFLAFVGLLIALSQFTHLPDSRVGVKT